MDKLDEKLVEKSKEAFCLAIELYNKPTIKYRVEGFSHFIELKTSVDHLSINNNAKFAIRIDHHYYITKNKDKATNIVHFDKNATSGVTIIKELQDPNNTHNYTAKSCINIIESMKLFL